MSSDIRDKIKSVLCRKYKQGKNVNNQHQHSHKKQGESSQCDAGQPQQQQQQQHLQEEEQHQNTTIADRQTLIQRQNEGEECCSSRNSHGLNEDKAELDVESNRVQTVPTSAATLTTMSSVPPLMTSEHQTISTTETSITAALITSPTSSTLLLSSLGVLSSASTPDNDNDTACTLPSVDNELCKSCEFDVPSTAFATEKEPCEHNIENKSKSQDGECKTNEHSSEVPSENELRKRIESNCTHDAETELDEQPKRRNATSVSKPENEKRNELNTENTADAIRPDTENTRVRPAPDAQENIVDIDDQSNEEMRKQRTPKIEVSIHPAQKAQTTPEMAPREINTAHEKNILEIDESDACEKNIFPNRGSSESEADIWGKATEKIEERIDIVPCEKSLLGANYEIDGGNVNTIYNVQENNIQATRQEASTSSPEGVNVVLLGGAKGALSKVPWSGASRFKSKVNADKDKGEAVLLDSDDDMVEDDDGGYDEKDNGDEKDEIGDEGGRLEDGMLDREESNVRVSKTERCPKPVVGPDGLMDVFSLQKELEDGYKQLNQEFDEYRSNEKTIQRLCAEINELRREVTHVKELNDRSRNTIKSLQDEVNTQRCNLTSACDSKSSMSKSDAQLQRLERKCYRDYYSMKDEKDAKSLLDNIRDKMKSLTRLETLVHRKRLVLKHALPVTLKDAPTMKIPVAKKTRKLLDFTKNGVGGCRVASKTAMNPVVVEILSCLADSGFTSFMTAASSQHTSTHSSQLGALGLTEGTPTPSTLSTESDDVSLFARVVRHHQGTPVD